MGLEIWLGVEDSIVVTPGFHPGLSLRGGKHSNCQIEGGEDCIAFLGFHTKFVREGIVQYSSNYTNKGDLVVLPQEYFEIYDL